MDLDEITRERGQKKRGNKGIPMFRILTEEASPAKETEKEGTGR